MTDRNTPIRRGEIYCSPGCGLGCTKAEHELAQMRGEMLVARLNAMPGGFTDWEARVWENCGWHYEARRPVGNGESWRADFTECQMIERRNHITNEIREGSAAYWCSIVINGKQFHNESATPEAALVASMKEASEFIERFQSEFGKFKAVL